MTRGPLLKCPKCGKNECPFFRMYIDSLNAESDTIRDASRRKKELYRKWDDLDTNHRPKEDPQ